VKVGDTAPDFTLMGGGFATTTLSELKGQKAWPSPFICFSSTSDSRVSPSLDSLELSHFIKHLCKRYEPSNE
jgi:hypothetical protein